MSTAKAIRTRIKSISNTRQITKAMELVASSKLRLVKERAQLSEPFFNILRTTMDNIAKGTRDFSSPFCTKHNSEKICHIVIAGDRGLAGGYNHNLFKSVEFKQTDIILPIGKKAIDFFKENTILSSDYEKSEDINLDKCYQLGDLICEAYLKEQFSSVRIWYTKFINVLSQKPSYDDILPIVYRSKPQTRKSILYEPSAEEAFSYIVPIYVSGMIYGCVTSSIASEICARRNSMRSATENANEMLDSLKLEYNRIRQAQITQELTEIIAGT